MKKIKGYYNYNMLGSHIGYHNGQKGVHFRVWAPNAEKVAVVGDFNSWNGENHFMEKEEMGIWYLFIPGIQEGDLYKYQIVTQWGEAFLKSDPYGFYFEKRPATASVVYDLNGYIWNDNEWQSKKKSPYNLAINIYEVHLGSWKRKKDGSFYSYSEIAPILAEYVKNMGYTHVEFLPLMEHPYDGSWGYQITGYYGVTSRYGRPKDFMYLVDFLHQNGIGVILDWVPGHFCKDAHGLIRFDGSPLYEYSDPRKGENKDWGTLNFDFSKPEVVEFLISNAIFWFDKFHVDGLRVDAVANILYLDYGKKEGEWVSNIYGGKENLEGIAFMKELNQRVFQDFPHALMIAEESTQWSMVSRPTYMGGLGYNFKWNMGWMNDTLRYMEMDSIHRKWHHQLLTFSFMYAFTENFILPLSHDEVVHGKKSLLQKMSGDYWQKFANLRGFYCYMMAHPGKKLLFMGGEFGQFIEWCYYKELDWMLLEYEMHQKLQGFVKSLNNFYLKEAALWEEDTTTLGFQWIDPHDFNQSVITFMRKGKKEIDTIIVICNFTPVVRWEYRIGVPSLGDYYEVFNSDELIYGGSGVENKGPLKAESFQWHNQPFSIKLTLPPLATVYLKKKDGVL